MLCICLSSGCNAMNKSMQSKKEVADEEIHEVNNLGEKKQVGMQGKISITTYFEDAYLEEAAEKFMKKYPDVTVEIHTFSNSTDNIEVAGGGSISTWNDDPNTTFEQYLTQLNVKFMGGNAEDMLCLYGMPVYKYVNSGYLMDMKDLLEQDMDINEEEYHMNIINAMGYKDGIYNIPLGYSIKLASINEDYINNIDLSESNIWKLDNMIEIAEKVHQQGNNCPMSMVSAQALFNKMFKLEANSFINITTNEVKLDSQDFINLLEKCKKLGENDYLGAKGERGIELPLFYEGDTYSHTIYNESYYTSSESKYIECRPLTNLKGNINIDTINSYGINKSSENKVLCFEFMKFLLSKEMQEKASLDALPINKLAAETKAYYTIKNVVDGMKVYGNSFEVSDDELVIDYLNHINKWSGQVNTYTMLETEILEVIYKETNCYFEDEKTAEDVAKILQNKIYMILNE